jgi:DNA-binding MarR family transcriptional regulator
MPALRLSTPSILRLSRQVYFFSLRSGIISYYDINDQLRTLVPLPQLSCVAQLEPISFGKFHTLELQLQMSANQLLDQSDYQRLAEFRYHLRGFLRFSERAASEMGLRPQQHQALLAIKGMPGGHVTIGILAERLGIRHNSAVELIDRLIKNSLVERRHNPRDRREVLIDLTNRAERILAKLSLAHRNEVRKLAPLLIGLLAPFESSLRKSHLRKSRRRKRKA